MYFQEEKLAKEEFEKQQQEVLKEKKKDMNTECTYEMSERLKNVQINLKAALGDLIIALGNIFLINKKD